MPLYHALREGVLRGIDCPICGFLIMDPETAENLLESLKCNGLPSTANYHWLSEMRARKFGV